MTRHNAKARARRAQRPIYFTVERLVRPATGELVGALVPRWLADQMEMRNRGFAIGTEWRGEMRRPRNVKFHRKGHALGQLVVDHIAGFEHLSAHDAVKRLQGECGVQCDPMELDLGPLGKVSLNRPRSLAFDQMEEDEFEQLWNGVIAHIRAKYWPGLSDEAIEELVSMTEDGR